MEEALIVQRFTLHMWFASRCWYALNNLKCLNEVEVNSCAFLLSRYFFTVDTPMSDSWLVSCFNKYVGVRDLYSPSCWLSNKWSAHLRIVCSKSSPSSTPYKLYPTQWKELPITFFYTLHACLHRALRSIKPIDLSFWSDFGVIGMGVSSVSWLSFTILYPLA